jgi:hypothetical protein
MNTLTTLLGGRKETLTLSDGTSVEVFVRQLPVSQMDRYLKAQDSEAELIRVACVLEDAKEIPADFADRLLGPGLEQLVNAIEEVNSDFFSRWLARQSQRMERMAKAVPSALSRQPAVVASPLPITSPKPPSNAA